MDDIKEKKAELYDLNLQGIELNERHKKEAEELNNKYNKVKEELTKLEGEK